MLLLCIIYFTYVPNQAKAEVTCGLGPLLLVLPKGLKNHKAEDNKCLLVVLALRYHSQALPLVLKDRMQLMGEAVWSSCSLLPLLSQGLFPPFHFHEKQQTLVLDLELPCEIKRGWSSSMSPMWISVCIPQLPSFDQCSDLSKHQWALKSKLFLMEAPVWVRRQSM